MLGNLPVPGRPTNLDYSRAGACCAGSRCGWGLFGHFFSRLSFLSSFSLFWETARYRLKYCLKGPLNPKPPTTNQPTGTYCKRNMPLPYYHPNCRTPRYWRFTQDHRITRPPPTNFERALRPKHLLPIRPTNDSRKAM